jgi:hypothetical protein
MHLVHYPHISDKQSTHTRAKFEFLTTNKRLAYNQMHNAFMNGIVLQNTLLQIIEKISDNR